METNQHEMQANPLNEINVSEYFQNLSFEQKNAKQARLIRMFTNEFEKYLMIDPVTKMIFELLLRGADPFQVIEKLLVERQNMLKYLDTNVINNPVMKS